ncbi:MAG: hypothetical protein LBG76_06610 [Treponema sp.]|nr:hypothetical protein [Treponema sp.]
MFAQSDSGSEASVPAAKPIVSTVPFRGSPQSIVDDCFAALGEVFPTVLPDYVPVPVDMNNLPPDVPANGQPAYVCPSPSMTAGAPYALTGEIAIGEDEMYHLRLYLWDTSDQRLVFSDEVVVEDKQGAEDMLPGVLIWIFGWLKETVTEPQQAETIVVEPEDDGLWRFQPFYVKWAQGADVGLFIHQKLGRLEGGSLLPVFLGAFEWHFSERLALEVDPIRLRFLYNGDDFVIGVTFPLLFKGTFRPSVFMIEPYVGLEPMFGLTSDNVPPLSVIAGGQFSMQAGPRSAWTLDIGVSMSVVGKFTVPITGSTYGLLNFYIMGGYKFGFGRSAKSGEQEAPENVQNAENGVVTDNADGE